MKKCSRVIRGLPVSLAVLLILVFPMSASAQGTGASPAKRFSNSEGFSVQPRGFVRQAARTLTSSSRQFMRGANLYGENTVSIQFVSSCGPVQLSVYVIDGAGSKIGPKTICLADGADFALHDASGPFSVYARNSAGYDGEVTLNITLANKEF